MSVRRILIIIRDFIISSPGLLVVLAVGFILGVSLGTGPTDLNIYESTKCLVEQLSGIYEFDDVWHIPMGINDTATDCESVDFELQSNSSDITMDELVYTFQVPLAKNGSMVEFSKFITTLEGFLMLDVAFKENATAALYPKLTFEAKIGYRDKNDGEGNWTLYAESTETRNLQCYVNAKGMPEDYKFGCNFVPFFKMSNVHHDYYLINLRFPTDFVGKTAFNFDISYIQGLKLVLIHQRAAFIKLLMMLKILCYPFSVFINIWFVKHLSYHPLLLMEKILLVLGFSLICLNIPLEFFGAAEDIPCFTLIDYMKRSFFNTCLLIFLIVFCEQFFKPVRRGNLLRSYWLLFVPLLFYFTVFLLDLFERGVQMENPFFSTWNLAVGIRHFPVFYIASDVIGILYAALFAIRLLMIYLDKNMIGKFYLNTRGGRVYKGGYSAYKYLMQTVLAIVLMTLLTHDIGQRNEIFLKSRDDWVIQYDGILQSGLFGAAYLMWNYGICCLLILYAPSHRYIHPVEEEERNEDED